MFNWQTAKSSPKFICENRSGATKAQSIITLSTPISNRSKNRESYENSDKNSAQIAMQSQLQTCKRYQTNDNMFNTVPHKASKRHKTSMDKPEIKQRRTAWNQQKSVKIIPNENVIIRICKKLFRKWLPVWMVSVYNETKTKSSSNWATKIVSGNNNTNNNKKKTKIICKDTHKFIYSFFFHTLKTKWKKLV